LPSPKIDHIKKLGKVKEKTLAPGRYEKSVILLLPQEKDLW
jgi:hypothetical protein